MPENSQHRQNPCPAWIWLILLIGLALLYFAYHHAVTQKAPWIQQDIQSRIDDNLAKETNLRGINVSVDGRDVMLLGDVPNQDLLERAEDVARQTTGVRLVKNQIQLAPLTVTETVDEPTVISPEPEPESPKLLAKVEPLPAEFAPLEDVLEKGKSTTVEATQAVIAKEKLSQLDFSNITFEKNSTELTATARSTLDLAATALIENPSVNINVNGHTDSSGNPDLNLKLSKQRAQAVLEYFVNVGIDSNRINANGYGDQFPIAPNDTQAGRVMNRRIEIKVINGE